MGTVVQRRLAITVATTVSAAVAFSIADRQVNQRSRLRPLLDDDRNGYTSTSLSTALPSLKSNGVVIVKDILDDDLLKKIRSTELYKSMPTELRRPSKTQQHRRGPPGARRGGVSQKDEETEMEDLWPPSAVGRYHRREDSFNDEAMNVFEEVEEKIIPLVLDFFDDDDDIFEDDNRSEDDDGFFRSEMQIFNAVPGSKSQSWHSDNQSRGITVIIPLVGFTLDNGPTQLLVGSHHDKGQVGFFSYLSGILRQGAKVIQTDVGSIAAYDSRIYHRGLGNDSLHGRPAIIFCFDRVSSPPPGIGNYGSLRNSYWAGLLHILSPTSWM